jgi:transglutaminase-like putative cysteine protease
MTPMTGSGQTTLFSQIECAPAATTWRYRDYWGTLVSVFDLQGPHEELRVTATSLVETSERTAPEATVTWDDIGSKVEDYAELLTRRN